MTDVPPHLVGIVSGRSTRGLMCVHDMKLSACAECVDAAEVAWRKMSQTTCDLCGAQDQPLSPDTSGERLRMACAECLTR